MSHVTGTAVFLATKNFYLKEFGKVTHDHCSTGNNKTGIYKVLNQTQITIKAWAHASWPVFETAMKPY